MHFGEVMTMAIVFYSIISFVKILSAHFLKRKIIHSGHFEKAGILDQVNEPEQRVNYDLFPALKWGLVAFFGGLGLIIIELAGASNPIFSEYESTMPFGIFLVFVALGFLVYYFMMSNKMKKQ